MENIILFILMQVVFIAYVSFIWIRYGIQKSISDSYYVLPTKLNFLFVLFTWFFAFPAMIIGGNLLMFIAGSGIAFVGAAAAMRSGITRTVHMIGAIGGIIASQLAIYFNYDMLWLNIISFGLLIPILGFKLMRKHFMWWAELVAFIAISIILAGMTFNYFLQ